MNWKRIAVYALAAVGALVVAHLLWMKLAGKKK